MGGMRSLGTVGKEVWSISCNKTEQVFWDYQERENKAKWN